MSEQLYLDPTIDQPASGDRLNAGLAAAFGPDSGPPLPAGGSVVQALCAGQASLPRILLREPESLGHSPIVRPLSEAMPPRQDPAARLQLHGEIARGGMGAVLKGRDVDLGRDVAVKVLLETHHGKTEMLQRFLEEAQISGQLQHPGIAPVYELGQLTDKRPYFTMKLVQGKTLATLLAARKTPDEERVRFVGIFGQVCQTLAYAHARGVIHRDLKPSNIMVGAFGEVQVMDWGLAKVLSEGGIADELRGRQRERMQQTSIIRTAHGTDASDAGSRTQAGTVLGTPAYMAPEQARGEVALVDERGDVFGLGAILCEILTGKPPYTGEGMEIAYKARTAKLDEAFSRLEASGADAELIDLTRRCLAAEWGERPRDAGVVAEQVIAYQTSVTERLLQAELARAAEEARAFEARATAAQERRARRMTLALAASMLLTVSLGGGSWLWLRVEQQARRDANNQAIHKALNQATMLRAEASTVQGRKALDLAARAREQARRAEALLESGPADIAVAAQVGQLLAELDADEKGRQLLADLEAIRLAQAETNTQRNGFASERAVPLYRAAFRANGMPPDEGTAKELAARLGERPAAVREAVLAALDEWIALAEDPDWGIREPHLPWLRALQRAAEPEGWEARFRDASNEKEPATRRAALEKLATTADVENLPVRALTRLALRLRTVHAEASAVAFLRRARRRHDGDFWINEQLGLALAEKQPGEAVRYLTAAVALRPDSAGARLNLGVALGNHGERDEAVTEYQKAIALAPNYASAYHALGLILADQGKRPEAIANFRQAIALDAKLAVAHHSLGVLLAVQGKQDEAIAEFKTAIAMAPKYIPAHYGLAFTLAKQGKSDEAIAEYRSAIAIDRKDVNSHVSLGLALAGQGKQNEAIAEYKKAIALDPKLASAHNNLGAVLWRQGKREEAIAEYRKGTELDPKDSLSEKVRFFLNTKHYATAAQLYAIAFAADAKLADDLKEAHRYHAVCAAARAACGQSEDANKLDDEERTLLRRQALDWLRADLAAYRKLLDGGEPANRMVRQKLQQWQSDPDLAGLHDKQALAKLPAAERQACEKLWADVAVVLKRSAEKK
jgi:serine/threonine-protein kinase